MSSTVTGAATDSAVPTAGRGGRQQIPRPERVRLGGPAPWAGLPGHRRRPTLSRVLQEVAAAQPEPLWDEAVPLWNQASTSERTLPLIDASEHPHGCDEMSTSERSIAWLAENRARGVAHVSGISRVGLVPSAVLVLLYEHESQPWVVLTRRADHLRSHAGEVSFPGGRAEPDDDDLWATALREAAEEISLSPAVVRRAGRLDSYATLVSGSLVCPFVAVTHRFPELVRDPAEVAAVLHVPLAELTNEETWREEVWSLGPTMGGDHTMSFFELQGDTVWGATAAILRRLLTIATLGAEVS